MKFIKIMLEMFLPIILIFGVFPKIFSIFKEVVLDDEKEKKKKKKHKKPDYIRGKMLGSSPPPPPKSRRESNLREFAENYEVRGGRIVKKIPPSSVKVGEKMSLDYESDLSIEEEFGTVKNTPKKKHFSKGVDPDFL